MRPTAATGGGYVLCTSPRSGSTLLCDLLKRSGSAGAPESYFLPALIPTFARTWGLALAREGWDRSYVEVVRRHGEAGTGRFGMRIMWRDMPAFLQRLEVLYPCEDTDTGRLRHVLGIDHFVHLSRVDKVAQAVSLVLAAQTGLWHRNADGSERERTAPHAEPRYDHDQIAAEFRMLEAEATGWSEWFKSVGASPITLTYEELAADPTDSLASVLEYIGSSSPSSLGPGTAKLATELNEEWSARFRNERKSAS